MPTTTEDRTLIEDWRLRRQWLAAGDTPEQYREMQLQLLDYLIGRYGDSPVAGRPARFLRTADVYWNDRAIVVHHHLRQSTVSGVKNQLEANRRVGEILSHLRAVQDDATGETASRGNFEEPVARPEISPATLSRLSRALRYRIGVRYAIAAALDESPYLPRAALAWLCKRLSDSRRADGASMRLLLRCRGDQAINYALRAWRERIAAGGDDQITQALSDYLVAEAENLDGLRLRLADVSPPVRAKAAQLLAETGTLDDVALFSDLLTLPTAAEDDLNERQILLDALRRLAYRS
ncbi:MAG TPA: hypothetical protein VFW87_01940 [Pirellulales bacterium]|nr:hypothetical protein [Pirellulales bacterium]